MLRAKAVTWLGILGDSVLRQIHWWAAQCSDLDCVGSSVTIEWQRVQNCGAVSSRFRWDGPKRSRHQDTIGNVRHPPTISAVGHETDLAVYNDKDQSTISPFKLLAMHVKGSLECYMISRAE